MSIIPDQVRECRPTKLLRQMIGNFPEACSLRRRKSGKLPRSLRHHTAPTVNFPMCRRFAMLSVKLPMAGFRFAVGACVLWVQNSEWGGGSFCFSFVPILAGAQSAQQEKIIWFQSRVSVTTCACARVAHLASLHRTAGGKLSHGTAATSS